MGYFATVIADSRPRSFRPSGGPAFGEAPAVENPVLGAGPAATEGAQWNGNRNGEERSGEHDEAWRDTREATSEPDGEWGRFRRTESQLDVTWGHPQDTEGSLDGIRSSRPQDPASRLDETWSHHNRETESEPWPRQGEGPWALERPATEWTAAASEVTEAETSHRVLAETKVTAKGNEAEAQANRRFDPSGRVRSSFLDSSVPEQLATEFGARPTGLRERRSPGLTPPPRPSLFSPEDFRETQSQNAAEGVSEGGTPGRARLSPPPSPSPESLREGGAPLLIPSSPLGGGGLEQGGGQEGGGARQQEGRPLPTSPPQIVLPERPATVFVPVPERPAIHQVAPRREPPPAPRVHIGQIEVVVLAPAPPSPSSPAPSSPAPSGSSSWASRRYLRTL